MNQPRSSPKRRGRTNRTSGIARGMMSIESHRFGKADIAAQLRACHNVSTAAIHGLSPFCNDLGAVDKEKGPADTPLFIRTLPHDSPRPEEDPNRRARSRRD